MQGIFQQATDKWYWDLWNCQKLSSELELKRKHILEVDQVSTYWVHEFSLLLLQVTWLICIFRI